MKKIVVTVMSSVLTIAAQGQEETFDTSNFVVTYDYAVQTKMGQDDKEIVDSCCVALMVGTRHTMQMEYFGICKLSSNKMSRASVKLA